MMNRYAFTLARRELRGKFKGVSLFLICLILGVGMIAAVKSLSRGLEDSIRHDGRYILAGDIAIQTIFEPIPEKDIRYLKTLGIVSTTMETRAMARNSDGSRVMLAEVKAVDPFYPLFGNFAYTDINGKEFVNDLQSNILPTTQEDYLAGKSEWGVLVEKEVLEELNLKLGDALFVGNKRFIIKGIITREPDRIGALRFTMAPRILLSLYILNETGLASAGSQVYYSHKILMPNLKTINDLQNAVSAIQAKYADQPWRVRTFLNASPQLQRAIDRLTLFLTLIGLTSLVVGGLGIANAVRSYLETRLPTIAMLKAVGATNRLVIQTYALIITVIAGFGIALGLAVGALLPYLMGDMVVEKLGLTNQIGFYLEPLVTAGLFGVLITFIFTFIPLAHASHVSARDLFRDSIRFSSYRLTLTHALVLIIAIQLLIGLTLLTAPDLNLAMQFVVGVVISFVVFYWAAVFIKKLLKYLAPFTKGTMQMAVLNIYRPGNLTVPVLLSLGLGLTVLVMISQVEENFDQLLSKNFAKTMPSFFFLDVQKNQLAEFTQTVKAQPTVRELNLTPSFRGRISKVNGVDAEKALKDPNEAWVIRSDRGFTYSAAMPANSDIIEGEWWPLDYKGAPAISIADDVARAFAIGVGDQLTVEIMGLEITARVMNVRNIDWSSFTMNFAVTFAPGVLEDAPSTFIGTVVMDENQETELRRLLANEFPNVTSIRVRDALKIANNLIGNMAMVVKLSAVFSLLAGMIVLTGAIAASQRRKIYDSVILKVVGARRCTIATIFLTEYALLGLLAALIASVIGTLGAYGVVKGIMDIEWYFSATTVAATVFFSVLITVGFSLIFILRILSQKPAQMLRN